MGVFENWRLLPMFEEDKGGASGGGAADPGAGASTEPPAGGDPGANGQGSNGQGGVDNNEPDVEDLDAPTLSKRQVAGLISKRINEVKGQYRGTEDYVAAAKLLGQMIGTDDPKVIAQHLQALSARQQGQTQQQGLGFQQQQPYIPPQPTAFADPYKEAKHKALEMEFDNDFVKDPNYSDAVLFKDQIIDLAENGFSMKQAYWAVAGELRANKQAQSAAKRAEQVVLNNIQNKQGKGVQPGQSGAQGGGKAPLDPSIVEAANKVGMDPEEYATYMGISSIEDHRQLKRKN